MVSVRPAEVRDARAIADVHVASWQWAYAGLLPGDLLADLSVDARAERWAEILSAPAETATSVACRDERVVGWVTVGPGREDVGAPSVGELWALNVSPDVAGAGVGHRLHEAGVAWLAEEGFPEAYLWVLRGNARARAFYERQGWRPDGGEKVDVRPEGFVLDEVRYRRSV